MGADYISKFRPRGDAGKAHEVTNGQLPNYARPLVAEISEPFLFSGHGCQGGEPCRIKLGGGG